MTTLITKKKVTYPSSFGPRVTINASAPLRQFNYSREDFVVDENDFKDPQTDPVAEEFSDYLVRRAAAS